MLILAFQTSVLANSEIFELTQSFGILSGIDSILFTNQSNFFANSFQSVVFVKYSNILLFSYQELFNTFNNL